MKHIKRIANLLLLWLWIGFAGGAVVLLLFAAPLEEVLREYGHEQKRINVLLALVALFWVLVAGVLSYFAHFKVNSKKRIIAVHASGAVVFVVVFFIFLRAGAGVFGGFRGEREEVGDRFVFGPYPDRAEMAELKRTGFTGVISLLSPVVPFEAVLLEQERQNAAEFGIELVEASMLPWVSSNEEPLDKIRDIVRNGEGIYYVHCYLGRNRAQLVRFLIEEEGGIERSTALAGRHTHFARGALTYVGDTIMLGPLPTRDEWFGEIVRSGVRRVIAIVDDDFSDTKAWALEEKQWAQAGAIELTFMKMDHDGDTAPVLEAIRASPNRVYVHTYIPGSRIANIVRSLDLSGRQTVRPADVVDWSTQFKYVVEGDPDRSVESPAAFPTTLERGKITSIGNTIFLGPLPTPDEWRHLLAKTPMVTVVSLLNPENPDDERWIEEEKRILAELNIPLVLYPLVRQSDANNADRLVDLAEKGPIYVHGFLDDHRLDWVRDMVSAPRPLPSELMRGPIIAASDTIFLGPMPSNAEWLENLGPSPVKRIISLLDPSQPAEDLLLAEVRAQSAKAGIDVITIPAKSRADAAAVVAAVGAHPSPVYVLSYRHDDRLAWMKRAFGI